MVKSNPLISRVSSGADAKKSSVIAAQQHLALRPFSSGTFAGLVTFPIAAEFIQQFYRSATFYRLLLDKCVKETGYPQLLKLFLDMPIDR